MINFIIIGLFILLGIWLIIGGLWKFLRIFFHNNYSFFDISFVILYFVEQIVLILLLRFFPEEITTWVSLFSLIVITTATVQKGSLDSKDNKIRRLNAIIRSSSDRKSGIINDLTTQIKKHLDYIKELENIL
jgi:hypothetical protein